MEEYSMTNINKEDHPKKKAKDKKEWKALMKEVKSMDKSYSSIYRDMHLK